MARTPRPSPATTSERRATSSSVKRSALRPDPVALIGAVLALVGATVLPFVELRPNRLAPGSLESLSAAGWFAVPVVLSIAAGFAAALAPWPALRRAAARVAGWALIGSVVWALGAAAASLLEGGPDVARVSVGGGAWLMLAGAAVLVGRAEHAAAIPVLGVVAVVAAFIWGDASSLSLAREFAGRADSFWALLRGHLALAGASLLAGCLIGIPLGLWASRNARVRAGVLAVTGVIETVPSLALLGLLVVPLAALSAAVPALRELGVRGIGPAPGFIALTLYALLPVVRNTYVGLAGVSDAVKDAGRGMGMSGTQLLKRVEIPLAAPLIVDGVRIAAVLLIGITTLTVFAGARNLGTLIFEGLGQFAPDLILLGALPTIALAVLVDAALSALGRAVTPKGVRA